MVQRTVNIQTVIEAEDFFHFFFLPKALLVRHLMLSDWCVEKFGV